MKKLYDKNELTFAIVWIVLYCVVCGSVRGNFGDASAVMAIVLAVIAAVLYLFIKKHHLEETYGLQKWKGSAKDYAFFIPLLILSTGNLWGGFGMEHTGAAQVFAVISMCLVGFVEEIIFRGLLFRILLKKDPAPVAITISAVTFGIGHIINLFTGHASFETVIQIFFAVAWGFIFTFVFYKSGCLWVCIAAHSLIDIFSKFAAAESSSIYGYVYMIATIATSIAYCAYLSRKPAVLK